MVTNFEMVREFHQTYGVPVADGFRHLSKDRQQLRISLIQEEFDEYQAAVDAQDIIEQADGLADLLYVVYGACLEHGFDADALFKEVHRSNMSKLGEDGKPIYRQPDKKVLKGPNFSHPDIAGVLFGTI